MAKRKGIRNRPFKKIGKNPQHPPPCKGKKIGENPHPAVSKNVRAVDSKAFYRHQARWLFSCLDLDGPFGWNQLRTSKAEVAHTIKDRLAHFESMTWGEILLEAKKQNHSIEVSKIIKEAQDRLIHLELNDVDQLISLRVGGAPRIWGLQKGEALAILWWDPEHKIYPTGKR